MKKLLLPIITFLCSIGTCASVFASSFSVTLSGNTTFTDSTVITATLGGFSGVDMTYGGISVITANITYDAAKINLTPSALGGFSLTNSGTKLVLDRAEGVASGSSFLSFKITNKGLSSGESTSLTLSNIVGSDSSVDISAANTSVTLTYKEAEKKEVVKEEVKTEQKTNTTAKTATTVKEAAPKISEVAEVIETEEDIDEDIDVVTKNDNADAATNAEEAEAKQCPNITAVIIVTIAAVLGVLGLAGLVVYLVLKNKQKVIK